MISYQTDCPDKFPLYEIAVISCARCKSRYRASVAFSKISFTCPRCGTKILVGLGAGALVPRDGAPAPKLASYLFHQQPSHELLPQGKTK